MKCINYHEIYKISWNIPHINKLEYNKLEDVQPMEFLDHKKLTVRDGNLSTQDVPMLHWTNSEAKILEREDDAENVFLPRKF